MKMRKFGNGMPDGFIDGAGYFTAFDMGHADIVQGAPTIA